MALLAGVLLRNLQFNGLVRSMQSGEKWRGRFAHLEINGTILDLDDDVIVEGAIQRMKIVVGGFRPIVLQIVPIEVVVVNEGPIKNDSTVGLQRARNHVGCIGRCSAICRRTKSALGIRFDHEPTEVGNMLVNFVDLLAPPFADPRIERIKRVETTHDFRAAQIDGQRELHAPGTKHVGDAADLRNETVLENTRSCVHVVDGAAIDPDRCQQTSVLTGACQDHCGPFRR